MGLVNGSQLAVFYLVNMFSGAFPDGSRKRILLPLAPEYVGYADQGLDAECFRSQRPTIEMLGAHSFKYCVDFNALRTDESTGALLVSRPTNPSGNVVTDAEVLHLAAMALPHGAEHEPSRELLGQCADGAVVSQLEDGVGAERWLHDRP